VLGGLGHEVRLIAPEAVRPFVKRGKKNDAADAAAICAAASRPDARFVAPKSLAQQGVLGLHSARALLVKQQTMLANAMRGLAAEFGLTVPEGMNRLEDLKALVDADPDLPEQARHVFTGLLEHCRATADRIAALEAEILAHARRDDAARRLATIPGVGPITASLIAATVGDSTPAAGRPASAGSPRRATGRSGGCWCSAPHRWCTGPPGGTAPPGRGPEGSWSGVRPGWRPWRWRTRWRASPGR
jgi:error-prone DNA polymerase